MAQKALFAEQADQFVNVVRSLLLNEGTRIEFAKAPLATLEKAGIHFADPAVGKTVETELLKFGSEMTNLPPPEGDETFDRWLQLLERAASVTWVAKPEGMDQVIHFDRPRVDAFVTRAALEARVTSLEQENSWLKKQLTGHGAL